MARKKADIIAELTSKGIEFDPNAKVADLLALLPAAEAVAEVPKAGKAPKAVAVYEGDRVVRVYSEQDNGEDFEELAEQFVDKHGKNGRKLEVRPYTPPPAPKPTPEETELVKIIHPSGDVHRIFSLAQHGENYRDIADEFMKKHADKGFRLVA